MPTRCARRAIAPSRRAGRTNSRERNHECYCHGVCLVTLLNQRENLVHHKKFDDDRCNRAHNKGIFNAPDREPESIVDRGWNSDRARGLGGHALTRRTNSKASSSSDRRRTMAIQRAPEAITALPADVLAQNCDQERRGLERHGSEPRHRRERRLQLRPLHPRHRAQFSRRTMARRRRFPLHQNGIFIPNPLSLSLSFLDVDHIEVLRGPQGTVFGQNSVGGTLNIITVQPTFDAVKGIRRLRSSVRSISMHVRTAVNLPVSSTLCAALRRRFHQAGRLRARRPRSPAIFVSTTTITITCGLTALFQPNDDFSLRRHAWSMRKSFSTSRKARTSSIRIRIPGDESSDWPGLYNIDQTIAHAHRDLQFRCDDVQVAVERAIHESRRIELGERAR